MNVIFQQRNFSPSIQPAGIRISVQRYSKAAIGGPKQATLRADAPRQEDLWELIKRLRAPVEIYADEGDLTWWGYISEIAIYLPSSDEKGLSGLKATVNLDSTFNRVAVAYEKVVAGSTNGSRETTTWVQDDGSIGDYGTKELLDSSPGTTQAYAEFYRDNLLERRRIPKIKFEPYTGTEMYAEITCRGWWSTLEWKYAPAPLSLAFAYEKLGALAYNLGSTLGATRLAQAFDVQGSAINAASIGIYIKKVGNPDDDLKVSLFSNPDDLTPTTELVASEAISGSDLDTDYAWYVFPLSDGTTLAVGSYFIVVDRSGDQDGSNYYSLLLDGAAGYDLGPLRAETGGVWSAMAADMPFRVYSNNLVETSQQVRSLITAYGQFFRAVDLQVNSGVSTESYRDGDGDARVEVETLLDMGTINGRRMLASVDPNRRVTAYEEPDSSQPYHLRQGFQLFDPSDSPIRKSTCPVGIWARAIEIVPDAVSSSLADIFSTIFIESAEYDVEKNSYTYQQRDEQSPMDIGNPRDG